jgi:hypothetical protein
MGLYLENVDRLVDEEITMKVIKYTSQVTHKKNKSYT